MSILSKPYSERRVLIVAPRTEAEVTATSINWAAVFGANAVIAGAGAVAGAVAGAAAFGLFGPVAAAVYAVGKGVRALSAQDAKAFPAGVLAVPFDAATHELSFPPGHPLADHAYAGHPLAAARYVPYEVFHRFLFEEKVNELMTILASLGATRVRVSCSKGYRTAGGVSVGVSKGVDANAAVKGESKHSEEATFEEHFRPKGEPRLPENVVWYASEASWQAVAKRRLDFGLSRFKAQLRYEDSFGIDGNLKVGLDKLGVKLGGNYADFESTEWEFEGEFA